MIPNIHGDLREQQRAYMTAQGYTEEHINAVFEREYRECRQREYEHYLHVRRWQILKRVVGTIVAIAAVGMALYLYIFS